MVGVAMRDLINHTVGIADAPSAGRLPDGDHARLRPRRARTGLAAVVAAAAVVTAGCASSSTSSTAATPPASSSSGTVHFPATLFGMPHNTSAEAQRLIRGMT